MDDLPFEAEAVEAPLTRVLLKLAAGRCRCLDTAGSSYPPGEGVRGVGGRGGGLGGGRGRGGLGGAVLGIVRAVHKLEIVQSDVA